ncbi:hypothetical protein [Rhizobium sp. P32RR-XVIII]|nr:hypothetical protein [Rhizobium sp. P32RR-XVIII]
MARGNVAAEQIFVALSVGQRLICGKTLLLFAGKVVNRKVAEGI